MYFYFARQIMRILENRSFLSNKIRWFQCTFPEFIEKMLFIKQIRTGIVCIRSSHYWELKRSFTHFVPMFLSQKQPFADVLQNTHS